MFPVLKACKSIKYLTFSDRLLTQLLMQISVKRVCTLCTSQGASNSGRLRLLLAFYICHYVCFDPHSTDVLKLLTGQGQVQGVSWFPEAILCGVE